MQHSKKTVDGDFGPAVHVADEAALGHSSDDDMAVAAAARCIREPRERGLNKASGARRRCMGRQDSSNARVFLALGEVRDDCGVQNACAARAHSVAHLYAGRDERHAGGVYAGAAHASIDLIDV